METTNTTDILGGYFDVKIYRNGVAREQRQMKNDGDTITFNVAFSEYPSELMEGKDYIREAVVNGLKRYYVSFKVGRICRFFDKDGKPMDRPKNADLDGKRWDCRIRYKVLHGDASKMQPRGFWADAVQIKPADDITFEPMDGQQNAASVTNENAQMLMEQLGLTEDQPIF